MDQPITRRELGKTAAALAAGSAGMACCATGRAVGQACLSAVKSSLQGQVIGILWPVVMGLRPAKFMKEPALREFPYVRGVLSTLSRLDARSNCRRK
jgi:hypothetical protein